MSKWLKEPLLHFLLLGALIFLAYGMVSDERSANEIFISAGQQDNLINTFSRTWQRPPTAAEFKGLLDDYLREEIAYREGIALGLDDDDVIIRRRLRQKLELLAEDVASLSVPSDVELHAFLDEHAADYQIEPRFSFEHIYFSPDRRSDPEQDARAQLAQLLAGDSNADINAAGDPIALPAEINGLRLSEIARLFGTVFSNDLADQQTGQWLGPLQSGFGVHLVFIEERIAGSKPELEQVRDAVQRDWFSQRRREAVDGLYARLAETYQIEVEPSKSSAESASGSAAGAAAQ